MHSVEKIHELLNLKQSDTTIAKNAPKVDVTRLNLKVKSQRKLKWVKVAKESSNSTDLSILLNVKSVAKANKLHIKNKSTIKVSNRPVKSLVFHPNDNIIALLSAQLSLININSKSQQAINIEKFSPVDTTFNCDGSQLYILGRKSLVLHDMQGAYKQIIGFGNNKLVNIKAHLDNINLYSIATDDRLVMFYDCRTSSTISSYRMKSDCKGMSFVPNTNNFVSIDADGCFYLWDSVAGKIGEILTFDKLYKPTTLSMSSASWAVIGTESGYLGLLDISRALEDKLVKCFDNMTTKVTGTAFTTNGCIAAYSTPYKSNGIRLIDVGGQKIYSRWPNKNSTLGRIHSVAMGKHLALGTKNGIIKVFTLN